MKTLQLFGDQTGLVFYEFKRCASKNAVFRFHKKLDQSGFLAPKSKIPPKFTNIRRGEGTGIRDFYHRFEIIGFLRLAQLRLIIPRISSRVK